MRRVTQFLAAAAIGAGGGALAVKSTAPVVTPQAVAIRQDAKRMDARDPAYKPLMAQLKASGGVDVECRAGVISNKPDRTYCAGGTAGFLLENQTVEDLAGAIEAAFPGLAAQVAYLQVKNGELWLSAAAAK